MQMKAPASDEKKGAPAEANKVPAAEEPKGLKELGKNLICWEHIWGKRRHRCIIILFLSLGGLPPP